MKGDTVRTGCRAHDIARVPAVLAVRAIGAFYPACYILARVLDGVPKAVRVERIVHVRHCLVHGVIVRLHHSTFSIALCWADVVGGHMRRRVLPSCR